MANEVRGALYETITEAALQIAVKKAKIKGEVRWEQRPAGMSILPDFTIGEDKDKPSHIILVTASGSAKETDKKFWRNTGELQEVKAQISTTPKVINLYCKSVVKKGLEEVQLKLYDSTLHVDKQPYNKHLEKWVESFCKSAPKDREAKKALLAESIKTDKSLKSAIDSLADDLAIALKQENKDLSSLWALMQKDYKPAKKLPEVRKTYVRRGLGKLLVIEPAIRQLLYKHHGKPTGIPLAQVSNYCFQLGFMKKSLGGARLEDKEIDSVLTLLGHDACEAVLKKAPSSTKTWVEPLRDLGRFLTHVDFVEKNYTTVTTAKGLKDLLLKCYKDPSKLSGEVGDNKVWIYEVLISLIKVKSGKKQGYGLSQLANDTLTPEFGAGGFLIPPFVQRTKQLSNDHIDSLATGLAKRFPLDVKQSEIDSLKSKITEWVIKENLEDRLIPYRNFEPLLWLLEFELKKQRKSYTQKTPYIGWLNEYADSGRKNATTPLLKAGKTFIHWKTSHDSHTNDKTKELSARARNLRYSYDTKTKKFSHRDGGIKLALIVDGTWTEKNIRTLIESGWETIIYPDEIADFVKGL